MDKRKRNIIIVLSLVIVLALAGLILRTQTMTVEFEDFSIEAPLGTEFVKMPTESDESIGEMYRANGEDLTITSFNKTYIEDTYYQQNGRHIDFSKGLYENFTGTGEITKINKNLTRSIITTDIDGQTDTDVACLYINDDHVIIVEGGNVDFITKIGKSIKILQ